MFTSACGLPPVQSYGKFVSNGTNVVNDTALLQCDVGFKSAPADSEATIVCKSDGMWSTSDAACAMSRSLCVFDLY